MKFDLSRVSLLVVAFTLPIALECCASSPPAAPPSPEAAPGKTESQQPASPGGGAAPSVQEGGESRKDFQARTQEEELRLQRNSFLVDRHVENAEKFLAAGALDKALDEVEAARSLSPANPRVLALRDQISGLMGERSGVIGLNRQEMEAREKLRSQAARTEVEQSVNKSKDLLALKEFDRALTEVDHALDVLRWSPYAAEWSELATSARTLRNSILSAKSTEEAEIRRKQETEATEKMRREEAAARAHRAEAIAAKLTMARDAFSANDFKGARQIAELILREDPRNERAAEIRDAAIAAEQGRADEQYIRAKKQAFFNLNLENIEARIPYTDFLELPPADYWEAISKLRDPKTSLDVVEGESEDTRMVREMLRTKMLPGVKIDGETDLDKVIKYLHDATGIPFVVTPGAKEKVTAAGVTFRIELPHPVKAEAALHLILKAAPDITAVVQDGLVKIMTTEAALGTPITRAHDVNDLIFGLTNFQGPRIYNLTVPGAKPRSGGPSNENPFGANFDPVQTIPPEEISTLIKDTIAPGTWEGQGAIEMYNGQLVVRHSLEVQRQVARFLADLRRYSSSLVTIEARFLTISENFLQSIGVDWRGLPNQFDDVTNGLQDNASAALDNNGPGLPTGAGATPSAGGFFDNGSNGSVIIRSENLFDVPLGKNLTENGGFAMQVTFLKGDQYSMIIKAVEKNLDVHEVNAQILSVANSQRSYITVVNQQSYIADYDVEVAQASFIAEPKINILQSGVVLDVKPTIHYNRKYITLELQPTVARVVAITDFTTTLGGLASAVTFQLPQLAVQSAFTSAVVPDGGSVLIGGLKSLREVELRSEVPWFGDLPIVGFFFKAQGYDSENENLMILIRARIADVREEVRKFERIEAQR